MRSKKSRNQSFCIGDLVEPNWKQRNPHGLGIIIDIEQKRWDECCITVCWQLAATSKEAPIDLKLLEQAVD